MKSFKDFMFEKVSDKDLLIYDKMIKKEWLDPKGNIKRILDGGDSFGYHGTNKNFDQFNISYLREWRADQFLGKGIFLTPDKDIAIKYANANANNELPITLLSDAKKVNKQLFDFMNSLYYKGNLTWDLPEFRKWIDSYYLKDGNWKYGDISPNEIADIVNLIPDSQSEKDYNKDRNQDNFFIDLFSTSSSALSDYHIEDLKKLGLGDYTPKVFTVYIKGTESVLLSKSVDQIKKSNHDIIIAYNTPDLIADVPEIIVKNTNLLKILKKDII